MDSVLLLALASFILSLVLTPICRNLFGRYVVDRPDGKRKLHLNPIPRIGGIPIAISHLCSYGILFVLGRHQALASCSFLVGIIIPAGIVFAFGLADDIVGLKPWQKMVSHVVAAVIVYYSGVRIFALAGHPTANWWSLPLTVLWLVVCTNAFNLIDGLDGVASGVGFLASLTILLSAVLQGNLPLLLAIAPLAAALLGFLLYNFNPASIFLGDSGSLSLGFLLGCFSIIWSQKSVTILGMTAPVMALSLPLLDVALSIVRRFLHGQPILNADRGHIHHRLLDRGFTPRRAALVLYAAGALTAVLSLVQSLQHRRDGTIIVVFCTVVWLGIRQLRYGELKAVRQVIASGELRRSLTARLELELLEQALRSAKSLRDCWSIIKEGCATFGFSEVQFSIAGAFFEERLLGEHRKSANPRGVWTLRVPLLGTDYIQFTCENDSRGLQVSPLSLAEVVRNVLVSKRRQFDADVEFLRVH